MAYTAPYIDSTGLHIPSYNDTLAALISYYKNTFGDDIYLDTDSMDYQQLSILAKFIYDTYLGLQVSYSSRSPASAVGVGLDTLGPLFSLTRNAATKSYVNLTITGTASTVITNGSAKDTNGVIWELPTTVTIPSTGSITVEAQSKEYGSYYSAANTITIINTPVYGWSSVTNTTASTTGSVAESDASFRARMLESSFVPSITVLEGLESSLEQLTNVTRVKCYENNSSNADSNGIPGHCISCVVEGGTTAQIGQTIYLKKTPGVGTYGDVSYTYTTVYGNTNTVNFYRPTTKDVYVKVYLTQLSGYNATMADDIKTAIVNYINNKLSISEDVYTSMLWSAALSTITNTASPAFSITNVTTSTDNSTFSASDISIAFNEVAATTTAKITIVPAN